MQGEIRFEDTERLLHSLAHRVGRRLFAANVRTYSHNDIFNELVIAWCIARDAFTYGIGATEDNPDGVPFAAYLYRGCINHINRQVEKEIRERYIAPFDIDGSFNVDEGDKSFHDTIADPNAAAADAILIEKDMLDFAGNAQRWRDPSNAIAPMTQKFLDLLNNPPPELTAYYRGVRQRAEYARERGMTGVVAPASITCAMVFDVMGVTRLQRTQIYNDIRTLSAEVNQ